MTGTAAKAAAPADDLGKVRAASCPDMAAVRREIDRLDRALVALLAERMSYIEQAGRIKPRRDQVRDPARIEDVIAKVRREAVRQDISVDVVEEIYRLLIERSIAHELVIYDQRQVMGNAL